MIAMISFQSAAAKMLNDRDSLWAALVARTAQMVMEGWASDLILLYSGSCRDILPHRCQTKIVEP